MKFLNIIACLLYMSSVSGLIMPMTKTDGTLDVSSLLSHIALMEQTIENKASAAEVEQLKSDLAASQKELIDTKTKLAAVEAKLNAKTDDLTKITSDLAASQKELIETKTKLTQVETTLDETTDDMTEVKDDLKKTQTELASLKNQSFSKDNTSNKGSQQLSQDVSQLKTDVSQLKTEVFQLHSVNNKTETENIVPGTVTFTRWGRTSCPVNNTVVYKGYTGGSHYADKASAATILCLPDQPIYNLTTHTSDIGAYGSHIFGTEYAIPYDASPFMHVKNEDMPCVVCERNYRSSMIMVPGRNECYAGWNPEYWGYLVGPSQQYAAGEYICVDSDPEGIPGGHGFKGGQLLYPVHSRCGTLPCPPYLDKEVLPCAVCSK